MEALPEEPVREGYDFAGWYRDKKSFSGEAVKANTRFSADTRLYALWSRQVGGFTVAGGTEGVDYRYVEPADGRPGRLEILTNTPVRLENKEPGVPMEDQIYIALIGDVTLAGLDVDVSGFDGAAAMEIESGGVRKSPWLPVHPTV